jgi:hypothetical protein
MNNFYFILLLNYCALIFNIRANKIRHINFHIRQHLSWLYENILKCLCLPFINPNRLGSDFATIFAKFGSTNNNFPSILLSILTEIQRF